MNTAASRQADEKAVLRLALYAALVISSTVLVHSDDRMHRTTAGGTGVLQGEDQVVNIPYFIESEDLHSTLTLNNNNPEQTAVTVTVFSSKGTALQLPPITLSPLRPTRFKLQELLADASDDFGAGHVEVLHHGSDLDVTSQISVVSTTGRLSFESVEVAASDFASTRLDGIAWAPDPQTQASVALTNTASSMTNVSVETDRKQSIVSLAPRETRVVDLTDLMKKPGGDLVPVLVTLEHDGAPGALIATGFALNAKTGFSSNLNFVDCGTVQSTTLAGAHLRFGRPNPADSAVKGTFSAPLLITNTMHDPTQARISIDYTIGSEVRRVELKPVNLAPREVKVVPLSQEMSRRGISGPVDDAGVDISYDGMPGTVIGRLTSYDSGKDYSFDVPVKDPLAGRGRGNGSYPWRLDNGYVTVLHLKNTLNKEVNAVFQVRYEGGSYNPDRIRLAPYQTVSIDIRQLRDAQRTDIRNGVMPKDVETGQIAWFEEEWHSMIGRAEVVKTGAAIASSFSCGECPCGLVYNSCSMSPPSGDAPVGASAYMFAPREMRRDCNFNQYGPYVITNTTAWYSSNTNVVTVNSSGVETCISPGSASITGQWQTIVAYDSYHCGCCPIYAPANCSATCDVFMPELVGVVSPLVSGDNNSTISGQAFTLQIQARKPGTTLVVGSFSNPVTVSFGTLISGESISQSPVAMSNGVGQTTVVIKVIDTGTSPSCCRTYGLAANGATPTTGQVRVWFPVTMDIERWKNCNFSSCPNLGSYFCTTACVTGGFASPFPFISLTANVCGANVSIRNTANGVTFSTTVLDLGPTTGNPYWTNGSIPSIGGCISDSLADSLGVSYGCNPNVGQGSVLWRFQ